MVSINEKTDPTGGGMFSKAGKFTSQKYSIFRKKDEILQDKRRYLRVSHFPQFEMQFHEDEEKSEDQIHLNQKYCLH